MIGLEPLVDVFLGLLPLSPRDVPLALSLHLLSREGDCLLDLHRTGLSWVIVVDSL